MTTRNYTAYVELDAESGLYVGTIPAIPGAHSQGATLDELQENLREVLELCLEEMTAHGDPFGSVDFPALL